MPDSGQPIQCLIKSERSPGLHDGRNRAGLAPGDIGKEGCKDRCSQGGHATVADICSWQPFSGNVSWMTTIDEDILLNACKRGSILHGFKPESLIVADAQVRVGDMVIIEELAPHDRGWMDHRGAIQ